MNIKKKSNKLLYIVAAILGVLTGGFCFAQNLKDDAAVRVSWDANPTDENVESYTVSWFDGSLSSWVALSNVTHEDDKRLEYITRINWIKNTLKAGDEICFRVVAVKESLRSEPTGNLCGLIPDNFAAVEVPEVRITELSTPSSLAIEWIQ